MGQEKEKEKSERVTIKTDISELAKHLGIKTNDVHEALTSRRLEKLIEGVENSKADLPDEFVRTACISDLKSISEFEFLIAYTRKYKKEPEMVEYLNSAFGPLGREALYCGDVLSYEPDKVLEIMSEHYINESARYKNQAGENIGIEKYEDIKKDNIIHFASALVRKNNDAIVKLSEEKADVENKIGIAVATSVAAITATLAAIGISKIGGPVGSVISSTAGGLAALTVMKKIDELKKKKSRLEAAKINRTNLVGFLNKKRKDASDLTELQENLIYHRIEKIINLKQYYEEHCLEEKRRIYKILGKIDSEVMQNIEEESNTRGR